MACCIGEILFQDCECNSISSFYHPTESENKILKLRIRTNVDISKVSKKHLWYLQNHEFFQKKLLQFFQETQKSYYNESQNHRS